MTFGVCVIGCGRIANDFHGPALAAHAAAHPDIRLVACSDVRRASAEAFAARFGFAHAEDDALAMLERHRPDAVCLYVPEAATCELACRVLALGLPLLMEKPPGLDPAELARIVAAAERHGVPAQVALNRRCMPLVTRLRAELSALGSPIQHLACEIVRHGRRDRDFSLTAIHGIDTVGHLAGSPFARVELRYQELPLISPGVANIHLACAFACGATAALTFCPVAGAVVERLAVHAEDHSLFAHLPLWEPADGAGRLQHLHRGQVVLDVAGDALPGCGSPVVAWGFQAEVDRFLDETRHGLPPTADVRGARQPVAIAHAIRTRRTSWSEESAASNPAHP